VVAASKAVAADARRVLGTKVAVDRGYSAIDLDRFAPGPADVAMLDRLAGLPPANPGTIRVGLVATYARWKGHGVFLEAARRVTAGVPIRFYIVGGPIYRSAGSQHSVDELRAQAVSLGLDLDTQLGFIGHQDDPAAILRALDVVVHASTQPEPFGRVIVEGMACGRAVIVSQAGGGAELFEPEISANAITRLATDPDLRIRLGIAGRAEAVERFDRNRLAEEWERVYLNQNSRIAVRS
jgi:glycosyltransferase involved in cell wall biosynthesis